MSKFFRLYHWSKGGWGLPLGRLYSSPVSLNPPPRSILRTMRSNLAGLASRLRRKASIWLGVAL